MDGILTQPQQTTPPTVTLMCLACGADEQVAPNELVTRIAEHAHCKAPAESVVDTCRVCGCTDEHGCDDGCEWADAEHTICSNCVDVEPAIPPLSIEELLATPAPFRAWLERMGRGFGRDSVIGEACASFACPLNQFLADETGRDRLTIEVSIAPPEVQLWRLDDAAQNAEEDGPAIPLPVWASALVRQVDLYPIGRKVVVDELLFLLDYVEQHLAVAGVLP
jgi:hypothetical protein